MKASPQKPVKYLAKYGLNVLGNGFEIIPIKPGTKRPPFNNWEALRATPKKLEQWIEAGRGEHGLGILTRMTPLVDIDCFDRDIVARLIEFTESLCGATLQRVGFAPKTGLVYRATTPFRKVTSKTYINPGAEPGPDGKPVSHKLEVLGDGQQFVALAIHPDTGKPYKWLDKHSPHDTEWGSLPEIDRDKGLKIVAEFERLAEEAGWTEKRALRRLEDRGSRRDEIDDDDHDFRDDHPIDMTTQELSLKLGLVPGSDDYDTWLQVGMALWHQYRGDKEGLLLWHEWSAQASNYDEDALDEKWPTFEPETGCEPVTARLIVKLANEEEKRLAGEQVQDTREEIAKAGTVDALIEVARSVKRLAFEPVIREGMTNLVRKRHKEITGDAMSVVTARQLTRYESPENKRAPKWLEGYVYIAKDELFYHTDSRMELSQKAFDAKHNRFMLTQKDRLEGRSYPEHTASHAALNLWEVETVYRRMYMPQEEPFFTYKGQRFVNSYTKAGVPHVPAKLSISDDCAITRVRRHLSHLFVEESAWKLLLDWLAYVVQTRRRISWMPLIQGTEGDGKTFFAELLKAVLGRENVAIIPGEAIEERYNHFMEGALVVFVEEVRLQGRNRYEALNRLKPWITNDTISIRAMHRGSSEIVNTASLIAATNHKDAIPAGTSDTRYYPLFSRWQTREKLQAFNEANPSYYVDLYSTLQHAGALRKWLLEHQIRPHFDPAGRAPESPYRSEMIALSETDLETAFREALAESTRADFCETLLESALLDDILFRRGVNAPRDRARNIFLARQGFTKFPRKLTIAGRTRSYWTREPERFCEVQGGPSLRKLVLDWIDPDQI